MSDQVRNPEDCFSRDAAHTVTSSPSQKDHLLQVTLWFHFQEHKVYVQHKIEEFGQDVWEALDKEKACFFIAG